ncbi:MAG: serine/threonine protein kinase [Alphaproteobacteria bacterium]|nr:serine/threonine protein kinase [Alphaproteobacteria bacterium]
MHDALSLQPGQTVDRFAIEAVLGRGGMATVYRARHTHLGTIHAIKVLDVSARSIHRRLLLEGRTQAALRHPNVVAVSDVVEVGDALGLVMEYVDGPSLSALLRLGTPSLAQANAVMEGVLAGVAEAHTLGVVHRDLKPGNVLLELRPGGVRPKITDFGLAKVLDTESGEGHTRSGASMGTPAYMAPEQVRDAKDVDGRADVFALGALAYELLSGCRAFGGSDVFEVMQAVTSGQRTDLVLLRPSLPLPLVEVVDKALAVERGDRYPDVTSMARAWAEATRDVPRGPEVWTPATLGALRDAIASVELADAPSVLPSASRRAALTNPTNVVGTDGPSSGTWMPPAPPASETDERPMRRRVAPWGLALAVATGLVVPYAVWTLWPSAPQPAVRVMTPDLPPPAPVVAAPTPVPVVPDPVPVEPDPVPVAPELQPPPNPPPSQRRVARARGNAPARLRPRPPQKSTEAAPATAPPEAEPVARTAPTTASVRVRGTDGNVWLRSSRGNFLAGRDVVPPGTYAVYAFFTADAGTRVMSLDVAAGDAVVLSCEPEVLRCSVTSR